MRLIPIPDEKYEEYRLTLMFDCYKWDPQFVDSNTVAKYALVITKEEHEELTGYEPFVSPIPKDIPLPIDG